MWQNLPPSAAVTEKSSATAFSEPALEKNAGKHQSLQNKKLTFDIDFQPTNISNFSKIITSPGN